jgi:hypothetical protein
MIRFLAGARSIAALVLLALAAAACSGAVSSSATGGDAGSVASTVPSSPSSATVAPLASTGPAGASAGPSAGDSSSEHTRYCTAIKLPDAQALLKGTITQDQFDPVTSVPHEPFDCTLLTGGGGGDNLIVTITQADTFTQSVADENAGDGTPLTGVGDKAVWVQDGTLANPPIVVAIKGSLTCRVTAPSTAKTTIEYTSPNLVDRITPAAAAAFAQKMGVLCTDVFGVTS